MDLHHLPEGTHSLAPRPGPLVRLTFQSGARGRTCTRTREGLSFVPLHWATRAAGAGHKWCPRPDLHRHSARFKGAVSALDYVGCWRRATKWCRVKDLHPQPSRSERDASASWANAA